MKKFLIAGSGLAAVAAAGSAGAVDVTLGGSIEMGIEYGLGKKHDGFTFTGSSAYQDITLNISAAGTTDAGLKFGGSFSINSAEEMKLNLYENDGNKYLAKLVNTDATAGIKGVAYNVSGGKQVLAGSMVSVKINSAWQGAKSKLTGYNVAIGAIAENSAICKIAGKANEGTATAADTDNAGVIAASNDIAVARLDADGAVLSMINLDGVAAGDGYLAAGRLTADIAADQAGISLTAGTVDGGHKIHVELGAADTDAADGKDADFSVYIDDGADTLFATADTDNVIVADAAVYAGPFAELKMTSSTTKMVVGAVCVTNVVDGSETVAYLDPASRILEVSNASIFLEGGFGKLTLQQGDYSGKVAAIGSAGDQATISSSGLVAVLEGASFMGMSGYGAVDVGSIKMGSRPNYMLGTSVDVMGLTVAVEMEDETVSSGDNKYIDKWDMGTSYAIGDLSMDFVLDSAKDWAVSASASLAGFTASSVIENVAKNASKKAGLSIDTTLSTDFNGISVSIGLDEDMDYTLSGSYALGNSGLAITASYDSEDNGGKVAAKMSF